MTSVPDFPPNSPLRSANGAASLVASASSAQPAHRQNWVDYAKGIAIALVVLGHANLGLFNAGIADSSKDPFLSIIDAYIYSFHMPVFFFVGGLFAERLRTRPAARSLIALGRTIAYPYFLWALIQTLLLLAFQAYANHTTSLRELATIVVQPPLQFWFLYVYFLIVLTYLLLVKAKLPKTGIALAFAALWVLSACGVHPNWQPLWWLQLYGIYFVVGDLVRNNAFAIFNENSSARNWWLPTAAPCFLLLALLLHVPLPLIPICAILGIAGTCCIGAFLAAKNIATLIRLCGVFSLEIYVLHTMFSAAVRIGLVRLFGITNVPLHVAVGTLVGLAIPLAIAILASQHGWGWLFRFPERHLATLAHREEESLAKRETKATSRSAIDEQPAATAPQAAGYPETPPKSR